MRNSLAFAALLFLVASCFGPVLEQQCATDSECGNGWRCLAKTCVPGSGSGGGATGVGGGSGTGTGGGTTGPGGGAPGGGGGSLCSSTTCLNGCCNGNVCIPTGAQNAVNCGEDGNQCLSCASGAVCKDGACVGGACDSTTCPTGCCSSNTCIQLGQQNQFQCGRGGGLCQTCGSPNTCSNGTCLTSVCNAQTCANGCCSGNQCVPFSAQSGGLCGTAGQQCGACSAGRQCISGVCTAPVCNSTTCSGCCAGNLCIPVGSQTPTTCGRGGAACVTCPSGNVCGGGVCTPTGCGPMTCAGCCSNGMCNRGTDPFACGSGGQSCSACPAGSTCLNGACQGCGPQTCAGGCCQFGFCQGGNVSGACGNGGTACVSCPPGTTCQFQRCVPVSNATVGSPCASDPECSNLGVGAICKRVTSTGNGTYQGGYCTLRCGAAAACPMGSSCASAPTAGENDQICLQNCGAGQQCRMPGYACYSFPTGGFNACWIFPTPVIGADGGFRPDAGFDAGVGRAIGAPCTDNFHCQPPGSSFCLPEMVSMLNTGYLGGYCSRNCGAGNACPAGSVCITEVLGGVTNTSCKQLCFNPGGGQNVCRTGYICTASAAGAAWCGPRCNNQSFPCPGGGMCNFNTGYCQ